MSRKRILAVAVCCLLSFNLGAAAQSPAIPQPFEDRTDPVLLLASFYNAVNRYDYPRAYGYWESAPHNASLIRFAQGYSDTASVLGIVRLPVRVGAAAGSSYAALPTTLIASHYNGGHQLYVGCYVARRFNVPIGNQLTPEWDWSLYEAEVTSTANPVTPTLMDQACVDTPYNDSQVLDAEVYDNRATPTALLTSYYNAVNRHEYGRAYGYWETPPKNASLAQFTQGYVDTAAAAVFVGLSIQSGGAAGSFYTEIPTLLVASHTDGSHWFFAGCFVMRRPNVELSGTQDASWRLYSASLIPVADVNAGIARLAQGCIA